MSRKTKSHIPSFKEKLADYVADRSLDVHQYSQYHFRVMDGGYVVVDLWTTGRYYILMTDYLALTDSPITERGGETGQLPEINFQNTLDWIFYPERKNDEN